MKNKLDRAIKEFVFNLLIDKEKRTIHPMINIYKKFQAKCPECLKQGQQVILRKLTDKERKKIEEREGKDIYPDEIWSCDRCKFWCAAELKDKYRFFG